MIALKHILVATDFGDASQTAFLYGRELARAFGATLHVLHVADDLSIRAAAMSGYPMDFGQLQQDLEVSARQEAQALLSDEDRIVLHAEAEVVSSAAPAMAITTYARDKHIDLIVLGTHGRGAVAHMLIGSVAERVVRTAPCPVLTVRQPQHHFVLPDALQTVPKT